MSSEARCAREVQHGLRIGVSAKAVEDELGPADERRTDSSSGDETLTYLPARDAPVPSTNSEVDFTVRAGRVRKIVWERSLD